MTPDRREKLEGVLARRQPDLTILAESLHKPRNFSAVIRSCDAVGIHEVNVVPGEFHPRRHWRTSSGTEKWMGVRTHESIEAASKALKSRGFTLVAAHLSDDACDFREVDYTKPTALVLGTELFGVSARALKCVDQQAGMYDENRLDEETYNRLRFEWLHPSLANFCRKRDLRYPVLDENGELSEEFTVRS
jgi:tRNA (guanosine-2'-O-)-methyltransferase